VKKRDGERPLEYRGSWMDSPEMYLKKRMGECRLDYLTWDKKKWRDFFIAEMNLPVSKDAENFLII
jgi:hypothetical protein